MIAFVGKFVTALGLGLWGIVEFGRLTLGWPISWAGAMYILPCDLLVIGWAFAYLSSRWARR